MYMFIIHILILLFFYYRCLYTLKWGHCDLDILFFIIIVKKHGSYKVTVIFFIFITIVRYIDIRLPWFWDKFILHMHRFNKVTVTLILFRLTLTLYLFFDFCLHIKSVYNHFTNFKVKKFSKIDAKKYFGHCSLEWRSNMTKYWYWTDTLYVDIKLATQLLYW